LILNKNTTEKTKMKISIRNFKCWKNIGLKLESGKVTLMKGSSGVGKTTIFQSISWCLYENFRNVCPFDEIEKEVKTRVSIEFVHQEKKLKCTRYKNPKRFIINYDNEKYEDLVAQKMIENWFGTFDIWMCSSFISQGSKNYLLQVTSNDRFEILNKFAFHEDNPTQIIEKLVSIIKEKDIEFKLEYEKLIKKVEKFKKEFVSINNFEPFDDKDFQLVKTQIENLQLELQNTIILKNEQENIKNNVLKMELEYTKIKEPVLPKLDTLFYIENGKYENLIEIKQNIDFLEKEKSKLIENKQILYEISILEKNLIEKTNDFNMKNYDEIKKIETLYEQNHKICLQNDVIYDKEIVQKIISNFQQMLNNQVYLNTKLKIENIKNNISKIENKKYEFLQVPVLKREKMEFPNLDIYSKESLNNSIQKLKQEKFLQNNELKNYNEKTLECPHCNKKVFYVDEKLKPFFELSNKHSIENKISEIDIEIQSLEKEKFKLSENEKLCIKNYKEKLSNEDKRIKLVEKKINENIKINSEIQKQINKDLFVKNNLIDELEKETVEFLKLEEPQNVTEILPNNKLSSLIDVVSNLKKIVFIEKPIISSKEILQIMKSNENRKKIFYLREKLNSLQLSFDNLSFIDNDLKVLKKRSCDIQVYDELFNKFVFSKRKLENEITNLKNSTNYNKTFNIEESKSEIETLQSKLEKIKTSISVHQIYNKLKKRKQILLEKETSLENHYRLKDICKETECEVLNQICYSINMFLKNVCKQIFDKEKDIEISISVYKELKNKKKLKPQLQLIVTKDGKKYENITQLSGGESDRASIALTLAFNQFSNFPFIFFDESLSSLDIDLKEATLSSVKLNTNNSIVLILHDTMEGVFDEVIDLNKL
jgi:DNA repair exonuclease SbcCD ATPase subunit